MYFSVILSDGFFNLTLGHHTHDSDLRGNISQHADNLTVTSHESEFGVFEPLLRSVALDYLGCCGQVVAGKL